MAYPDAPPTRRSARTPKPTARKRPSTQLSPSQRRKRARKVTSVSSTATRRPLPLLSPTFTPVMSPPTNKRITEQFIELSDNEQLLDNEDEDNFSPGIFDDDAIEVARLEEQQDAEQDNSEEDTMKYLSVWKAVVNVKEILASQSAIYKDQELRLYMIRQWQDAVIQKAQPRKLEIVKLEAVASFDRCRAVDESPFELRDPRDITMVHEVLRMWHEQHKRVSVRIMLYLKEDIIEGPSQLDSSAGAIGTGRQTATQRQLAHLPMILQSEQATGNLMPQIADRWPCKNSQCRNKGKTCWQNKKKPDNPDHASNHYPVPGEIFRRWNREINEELSTVEQPSQNVIVQLVNWRERDRKKTAESPKPVEGPSLTDQLIQTFLVTQIQQITQQQSSTLQHTLPIHSPPPAPSSPIQSDSDPSDLLDRFFDWLILRSSEQRRVVLKDIQSKLLDEDWNLETLRDDRKGGAMTTDIWESYGFKLGTLAHIRSKISEFKHRQRPRSQGSNESNSSL